MPHEFLPLPAIDIRQTALGWFAIAVRGGRLLAMTYGHNTPRKVEQALQQRLAQAQAAGGRRRKSDANRRPTSNPDKDEATAADWADRITDYCDHGNDHLLPIRLADDRLTPFARQVTERCRQIPPGQTITYGELAAACGRPRAARAVGGVMARNPWPLVVPCHRVLASNGALGGYSAPQGLDMKRRLLAMEGVDSPG